MATTLSTKIRRTLAAVLAALVLAFAVPNATRAYVHIGTGAAIAADSGKHFGQNKGDGLDGDQGSGNDRNGNSGKHLHNGGHGA